MVNNMGRKAIGIQPIGHKKEGLPEVLERILDKGMVVDLKARIQLVDIELLSLRSLTVLSGFDTANEINLQLPGGIDKEKFRKASQKCLQCGKRIFDDEQCPWCGFKF
ncbi:MAG: gas vesicle protein GvpJ [Nanoarchaeota archaeon]|nr:gas vesicle protein GvpJ [Nanoarchaeota archaeon]